MKLAESRLVRTVHSVGRERLNDIFLARLYGISRSRAMPPDAREVLASSLQPRSPKHNLEPAFATQSAT